MSLHKLVNGVQVPLTPEEIEVKRLDEEYSEAKKAARLWKENRIKGYKSLGEQLDIMFHQGYEGWKAHIQAVKDRYPKPDTSNTAKAD